MTHEEIRGLLDDYADGALDEAERHRVEEHLEDCSSCRDELRATRALLARARELPRSIEPPHDLWAAIDARTRAGAWRHRTVWSLRYQLAAAVIALVAVSSILTAWLVGGRTRVRAASPTAGAAVAGSATLLAEWRAAEEEYLRATAELSQVIEVQKGELDPAVIDLIEHNLRVIDRAIQESRAALAADPTNRDLVDALAARYRAKIDVLQRLNRLTAQL